MLSILESITDDTNVQNKTTKTEKTETRLDQFTCDQSKFLPLANKKVHQSIYLGIQFVEFNKVRFCNLRSCLILNI